MTCGGEVHSGEDLGAAGRPGKAPVGLALVGPTASGKTALSLVLAPLLDGEIISMDSRQVYRGLDIGTAKPGPWERATIPHRGLDLVDPWERYSAGRFGRDARRWIAEIRARGRTPILVGGTGFFLRALLTPIFREPELDPARREALRRALSGLSPRELGRWVGVLDPARREVAVAGGRQRMVRTLEVALLTGRPLSWWHRTAEPDGDPVPLAVVSLEAPAEWLASRIERRARAMVEEGLVEEVTRLLAAGVAPEAPGMSATGYRETLSHLRGEVDREGLVEAVALATRGYARRQRTWFRNQLPADTLRLDGTLPAEVLADRVRSFWEARSAGAGPDPASPGPDAERGGGA